MPGRNKHAKFVPTMNQNIALPQISKESAIRWAGSAAELARRLDVKPSAITQWKSVPEGRLWQLVVLGCPEDLTDQTTSVSSK